MRLALCQFDMAWEDREASKTRIMRLLEEGLAAQSADWLIFPEMTLSGFSMDPAKTTLSAQDVEFFQKIARDRRMFISFGGVQEGFNRLLTLDRSGRIIDSYSKLHLFGHAGEDRAYRPGSRRERFLLEGFSVTPAVCFDLRFPGLFWDAAEETDLYVVSASWPACRSEHWSALLRARAIENQAYVVGVNRMGRDPSADYCGASAVFDPMGRPVLDCGDREGIFFIDVDLGQVRSVREQLPFLASRKTRVV
ncbi:MAG: nitrilase-related carbon-nitrogen hydrolase [Elusimicrobiota bacterium]|jgi:predicted amidohydrolase